MTPRGATKQFGKYPVDNSFADAFFGHLLLEVGACPIADSRTCEQFHDRLTGTITDMRVCIFKAIYKERKIWSNWKLVMSASDVDKSQDRLGGITGRQTLRVPSIKMENQPAPLLSRLYLLVPLLSYTARRS
jgi:hypothetical protein